MLQSFLPLAGGNTVGMAVLAFSFLTNGTGAVDQTTIRGLGVASVARAAAGKFTVTLTDGYYQLLASSVRVQEVATGSATAVQASLQIADESADPLVLTVYTFPYESGGAALAAPTLTDYGTAATDTDPRRVSCVLFLKTSQGA